MTGELGRKYLKDFRTKTTPLLRKYLDRTRIEALAIGAIPKDVVRRFRKLSLRGKRLRGALVVLGYEVAGGHDHTAILDTSLFIELFHTGALIHDDIMDQDALRRGFPTIHKQFEELAELRKGNLSPAAYGRSMAMNTGDLAFFLSWEKLMQGKFPPGRIVEVGSLFSKVITRLVYGQTLDITPSWNKGSSPVKILNMIRYKTADYTGVFPVLAGATLAGLSDQKKKEAMEKYGRSLGLAMQIRDDILGIFAKEHELGKPLGSDLREGKQTLLIVHLEKHGTSRQRAFISRLLGNQTVTRSDIEKMKSMLKQAGSYQFVSNLGLKYVEAGKQAIPAMTKDPKVAAILESLMTYMMERTV